METKENNYGFSNRKLIVVGESGELWKCLCKNCETELLLSADSINGVGQAEFCGCCFTRVTPIKRVEGEIAKASESEWTAARTPYVHDISLVGRTFGTLSVESRTNNSLPERWMCRCNCGRTCVRTTQDLTVTLMSGCGICRKDPNIDRSLYKKEILKLIGTRHGKLSVVSWYGLSGNAPEYLCKCDCDAYVLRTEKQLSDNASCGCARYKDHSGKKIGYLSVGRLCYVNKKNVWETKCVCGKTFYVAPSRLNRAEISDTEYLSCGCGGTKNTLVKIDLNKTSGLMCPTCGDNDPKVIRAGRTMVPKYECRRCAKKFSTKKGKVCPSCRNTKVKLIPAGTQRDDALRCKTCNKRFTPRQGAEMVLRKRKAEKRMTAQQAE